MTRCGLWATPRRLLAVVIDEEGTVKSKLSVQRTPDGYWALMASLGSQPELVLTDVLARDDPIGGVALRYGARVWTVPVSIAEGVRQLTGLSARSGRLSALLLARWPDVPVMRGYLRLASPPVNEVQVSMW